MKYLKKFNESKNSEFTSEDKRDILNIFQDYVDEFDDVPPDLPSRYWKLLSDSWMVSFDPFVSLNVNEYVGIIGLFLNI